MTHRTILTVALVALLAVGVFAPAAAAQSGDAGTSTTTDAPDVDECMNADTGPGDGGPPGFVADLTPDFLSDLMSGLPVPNFVKSFFGATTC